MIVCGAVRSAAPNIRQNSKVSRASEGSSSPRLVRKCSFVPKRPCRCSRDGRDAAAQYASPRCRCPESVREAEANVEAARDRLDHANKVEDALAGEI